MQLNYNLLINISHWWWFSKAIWGKFQFRDLNKLSSRFSCGRTTTHFSNNAKLCVRYFIKIPFALSKRWTCRNLRGITRSVFSLSARNSRKHLHEWRSTKDAEQVGLRHQIAINLQKNVIYWKNLLIKFSLEKLFIHFQSHVGWQFKFIWLVSNTNDDCPRQWRQSSQLFWYSYGTSCSDKTAIHSPTR